MFFFFFGLLCVAGSSLALAVQSCWMYPAHRRWWQLFWLMKRDWSSYFPDSQRFSKWFLVCSCMRERSSHRENCFAPDDVLGAIHCSNRTVNEMENWCCFLLFALGGYLCMCRNRFAKENEVVIWLCHCHSYYLSHDYYDGVSSFHSLFTSYQLYATL